ncbi:M23 family metallopeptidase [Polycladidibacter stylochi]|uniref:M23 family metallopeptidase n=1 Tax=Polycladidibacter stylochi TaxID=1807766 RepID=UPI001AD8CC5B|nr:M23 family metallopeptidase [Pseudovibrio stylochi]
MHIEGVSTKTPHNSSLNARWLIGTILTGVTSIALMGGALTAALDGQYSYTTAILSSDKNSENGLIASTSGKGDRLAPLNPTKSNRTIINVNTVTRTGNRDHIKEKPYALVKANFDLHRSKALADQIPTFDPIAMYQGEAVGPAIIASDGIYGANIEGEISISQSDFPTDALGYAPVKPLEDAEIQKQVKLAARFMSDNHTDIAANPEMDSDTYDVTSFENQDLKNLEVRITQENVSFQPKSQKKQLHSRVEERFMPVNEGSVLLDMLLDNEASEEQAQAIMAVLKQNYGISNVQPGQLLRFGLEPSQDDDNEAELVRVSIYDNQQHLATIALSDQGTYIASAPPVDDIVPDQFALNQPGEDKGPTPTYYTSLYQTALENQIPNTVVEELIRIYSFDLDYNSTVKPDDTFTVLYDNEKQQKEGIQEILYTSVYANGREHYFYRFRSPDDGEVDFYDRRGKSAKKFLLRKPIASGRFTSGFGMRRHPIRKKRVLHTGVDWAAPRGTPILAAGKGEVIKAGWGGGYGRRVLIRHANGYVTTYNHMSKIADDLKRGDQVYQGQVIGYVGTTGLSTGNHLHYEVKVNGRFVNPLKIKLPKGRTLTGPLLTAFERERDRIDALIQDDSSKAMSALPN